jgi:hypothetical protein
MDISTFPSSKLSGLARAGAARRPATALQRCAASPYGAPPHKRAASARQRPADAAARAAGACPAVPRELRGSVSLSMGVLLLLMGS